MFALYRKGKSHWVKDSQGREVNCEVIRVPLEQLDQYRSEGWTDDIDSVDADRVVERRDGSVGGGVNEENSPPPDNDPLNDNQVNNFTEETKIGIAEAQLEQDREDPAEASLQRAQDPEGDDVTVDGELVKKDGKFVDPDEQVEHKKRGRKPSK